MNHPKVVFIVCAPLGAPIGLVNCVAAMPRRFISAVAWAVAASSTACPEVSFGGAGADGVWDISYPV